ncbi:uncharacterized protein LOC120137500 isoform X1 [Hibiscus syriacus]|uniref:uncharacterized protein LOC120137500 isoform X1 n=1 Tax=Hibiscus syriacus TaxID=106335 RepID=UPI0019211569|nr:uncharacterized protein LOC120137500 isoform X1 [Hibiscus syriacus]XP_039009164.1 uncharacterized protein LOC120137500 isoform X1 [Hibiscus syriacus]
MGRQAEVERHNESVYSRSVDVQTASISKRTQEGAAEWQLKGKRKSRQISEKQKQDPRKYADMIDEPNTYVGGINHLDGFSRGFDQKVDCKTVEDQLDGFRDWKYRQPCVRGSIVEAKVLTDGSINPQRSHLYRQSRYTVNPRYQTTDFPRKTYSADSSLYDIKIDVKADYQPRHVPLVSLVSKLDGKAVVGHPLTVEALNNVYCDNSSQEVAMECTEPDHSWKQNSGGRVPRKHIKSQLQFPHCKRKKAKKSRLLSKKIRRLSSLTGQKLGVAVKKPVVMKPKGPVIACITLKLVFSRIKKSLNGPPLPSHRSLTSGNS